jgi:hypothetical protein
MSDIKGFKCFFMRHSITVVAATTLSCLLAYGMLVPEATIAGEKSLIFCIGGVLYALGWIRGHIDGQREALKGSGRKR